jgi:hypothetical protein
VTVESTRYMGATALPKVYGCAAAMLTRDAPVSYVKRMAGREL